MYHQTLTAYIKRNVLTLWIDRVKQIQSRAGGFTKWYTLTSLHCRMCLGAPQKTNKTLRLATFGETEPKDNTSVSSLLGSACDVICQHKQNIPIYLFQLI